MCKSTALLISLALVIIQNVHSQTDTTTFITFPMGPGNLWQYKEPPPPIDSTIYDVKSGKDTTFSNGKTYRQFISGAYGHPDTIAAKYRRQEGNQVFEYFPVLQIEAVKYDFSKNPGDTVSVFPRPWSDTLTVTVLAKGVSSFWGKTRNYMVFQDRSIRTTMYWIDYIADSIGIYISKTEPGFELDLEGARVDGVQYGNVTDVNRTTGGQPQAFVLYQNFPNPFNPTTTIEYQLSSACNVKLVVFDILSRQVAELASGVQTAGYYSVKWDASSVANGVYFARFIVTNDFGNVQYSKVNKLVVMK